MYANCSPIEKKYYDENIKISEQNAEEMYVETELQDDDLWHRMRYGRITGSICYSLFTYANNKKADWGKKLENTFCSTFKGNENTVYGLVREEDDKEVFESKNPEKKIVRAGILIHPLVPWLGYSTDGIICENSVPTSLWENKALKAGRKKNADELKNVAKCLVDGKLKKNHSYNGQVQLGMVMYSLPQCEFTLYSKKNEDVYINTVMFDEKFCLKMLQTLTEIYFKNVLPYLCSNSNK